MIPFKDSFTGTVNPYILAEPSLPAAPSRSTAPAKGLVFSDTLQAGTTQAFFPVISTVSTLVFLVMRKVIAAIFYALQRYSVPSLHCNQSLKRSP